LRALAKQSHKLNKVEFGLVSLRGMSEANDEAIS